MIVPLIAAMIVLATIASRARASDGARILAVTNAAKAFRLLKLEQVQARWSPGHVPQPVIITYAFIERSWSIPHARNCGAMDPLALRGSQNTVSRADMAREFAAAARQWEGAANVRFVEIADEDRANVLIGAQARPVGRAFTNIELTEPDTSSQRTIARAQVCLNPDQRWKIGFDGNLDVYDLRYTFAHELGHVIGLDHPAPTGQLMGYRYTETFAGPQPGDVAGAMALYGPPATQRAANSSALIADPRRDVASAK